MFTWRASPRLCAIVSYPAVFANNEGHTLDSAFGFNNCAADILQDVYQGIEQYKKESRVTAWGIAASRAWPSASPHKNEGSGDRVFSGKRGARACSQNLFHHNSEELSSRPYAGYRLASPHRAKIQALRQSRCRLTISSTRALSAMRYVRQFRAFWSNKDANARRRSSK